MDRHRSAEEVFKDHLHLGREGVAEEDLPRNYSRDVVILSRRGIHRGHDGLLELARLLRQELPDAKIDYRTALVEGDVAFLEWTADSAGAHVRDGADSFLIREGLIVAQTIHYTVVEGPGS